MNTISVKCNLCGADDYKVIFPEGKAQIHRIVRCNHCSLMYANPQTTCSIGGKISIDEDEVADGMELEKKLEEFTRENHPYLNKQYIQQKDYENVLQNIDNREKGTLLDIGSYAGIFLDRARRRGWNVLGIEPLALPRLYSKRTYGFEVLSAVFEKCNIEKGSIDVVVSFHCLEHVYDPMAFVQEANRVLGTGGLMVLETPTYDSLTFKLLRHRERSVKCDGHIFLFTRESLARLVERANFRIIKHETVGRTLSLGRLFHNIGIVSGTGNSRLLSVLSRTFDSEYFAFHLNMKDMQRIYCEKVK